MSAREDIDADLIADELIRLGYGDVVVEDGLELFHGDQWDVIAAEAGAVAAPSTEVLEAAIALVADRLENPVAPGLGSA